MSKIETPSEMGNRKGSQKTTTTFTVAFLPRQNKLKEPPTLPALRDGGHLVVWCEPELLFHYHGVVGLAFGQGNGHRSPHCIKGGYPYGYILEEVAERPAHWPLKEPRGRTREARERALAKMRR